MTPFLGLEGASQVALVICNVTERGRTKTTGHHFGTSRPVDELDPVAFLLLFRRHWGIESYCDQRLDTSLHENKYRFRSLNAAAALALLSRLSVAFFVYDCQRPHPVRDKTFPI